MNFQTLHKLKHELDAMVQDAQNIVDALKAEHMDVKTFKVYVEVVLDGNVSFKIFK